MKFLSSLRSKTLLKGRSGGGDLKTSNIDDNDIDTQSSFPPNPTFGYSQSLLTRLFSYVCPHSQDGSYNSCEDSQMDGGCMLCDMRDLAQCATVTRHWAPAAQSLLYQNVRLDSVHYCNREPDLVAGRRRSSFGSHAGSLRDPAKERLQLFARTVRERTPLADHVQTLKLPYMTRENAKADLARAVSVLHNLNYIDLPEGVFSNNPTSSVLLEELRVCCPNLRWMRYASGAEETFAALGLCDHWRRLEQLQLHHLAADTDTVSKVLSSLPALSAVEIKGLPYFDDSSFLSQVGSSRFPPVTKMHLYDLPTLTINGLASYLSEPRVRNTISSLTLSNTGIEISILHTVLALCPKLETLRVVQNVKRPFPLKSIPSLESPSLNTFHYEISTTNSSGYNASAPIDSYYSYLAKSVLSSSLPLLSELYALSERLPFLLSPGPGSRRTSAGVNELSELAENFTQRLNLYTKSVSELEWNLTVINPTSANHFRDYSPRTRPLSLANPLPLSPQWRDPARQSVVVGNGFGGYLTVPDQSGRPTSPGQKSLRKEPDAWMG
ncbi:uncharacterized protein KY384_005318 [Bacidia gigantensis]|uniref:uncharacterized protein n=1 Tax=Bacidia gigantensis TaxID=2732470 RepID=UPI001D04536F|nr:uncharacterized protein KY384_005318 [Bacidia gigantensis]KAG8529837.1 hypothetical protein KY384_005318 [Bacidia gigantensis]